MATSRAKAKVVKSIKNGGTLEQQGLILLRVLSDPSIRDLSLSISINMKEIKLGQQLLRCARKLIQRTQNGRRRTSAAKRLVVKALCVSLLPTPVKEPNNDSNLIASNRRAISMRNISKQLGFSVGTGHRTLTSAEKKRADIAEGTKEGWIMLTEDEQRSKYTDELISALEYWIENNDMVCHSPFKDNLVIKQDWNGSIVRDLATGVPLRVQKMMLMCNPRVLHNHMIQHFDEATEGNRVIISEKKVREILKTSCSHIKKMSSREKLMCRCETCIIFDDMHECLNLFRK